MFWQRLTPERLGRHYILVMMLSTRLLASLGGALSVYYVTLMLSFSPQVERDFLLVAAAFVSLGIVLSAFLGLRYTTHARKVLDLLRRGEPIAADLAAKAGPEIVLFPGRQCLREIVIDPLVIVLPICGTMWVVDDLSLAAVVQTGIAGCLGIAAVLLIAFFMEERWLAPLVCYLLERGVAVDFNAMPSGRLHVRLNVCVGGAVVLTAVMIGGLANQRAIDIIDNPRNQAEAVANLRKHTVVISVAAVITGLALSRLLADSIASRVRLMVEAMKRVEQGSLRESLPATTTDEIDTLARQFNVMVKRLASSDHTIRDLNANLEGKVRMRTRQLNKNRRSLKRSLAKMREYDRLKTEFFSNISHELRTPLTMILAPVERILDRQREHLPAAAVNLLEMVRVNAARLLELINKLLDFSKLEAGRMQIHKSALDVNALVAELAGAARPLAEQRGVALKIESDPTLPRFAADKEKVDIVVSNLLSNAIKFTPSGGSVTIATKKNGERAVVSVSDTGIGIKPEDFDRIFERFVQVDGSSSREFSGTGLGLALAKELVELHGGEIHVESEPGRGTRFWFELPLVEPASVGNDQGGVANADADGPNAGALAGESQTVDGSPQPQALASRRTRFADLDVCPLDALDPGNAEPSSASGSPTILVVDDTAEMRALLGELLREDYRVLFARDGEEGLEMALRHLPDLILSDVMMPRVDGQEFCRRIRANPATSQTAFVLLTARTEVSMKVHGLDCGADDYLTKPFEEEELKARVRSLLKLRRLHQDLDRRNRELEGAYRDLKSMQGQLIHSEKMSSLGQLVAGLAHEINNSINAVYNGIRPLTQNTHRLQGALSPLLAGETLHCQPALRDEIDGLFRRLFSLSTVIENGATRTARIIADLKTFSHPGKEDFDDFDLHESLDMCLNLLLSQVKHRIELKRDYGEVGRIHGPHGHLNQVFMNILNNAQQAIEGSGTILVTTRQQGDRISVSIRDDGPGIPDEIRSRIFDPFFTTKEPGLGTGLGLSISYGIIDKLGGTIECQSSPGEGAEFTIIFPCQAALRHTQPNAAGTVGQAGEADARQPHQPNLLLAGGFSGAEYETRHLVC
ncbi:MAG TPA: ATP-binding protein [Pirellulales bacterium]|nr:ATP-binding protein [Pirellulales bacterium]